LAEAGILMAYGTDSNDLLYQSADLIDKILKGAKAGDIPFQEPTRYQFILNKKTARDIGVTFPQSILVRADRVIQ